MFAAQSLLLVEDEVLIAGMLLDALQDAGFQVRHVESGTLTIADLDEDVGRFSAVVTDIRLPAGPDGWDIGQRARELVSDMPIVYMSGDSAMDWASKGVPRSVMLQKPFVPAQLITAISTLINAFDPSPLS